MEEIKVGEYVRTKNGVIFKITDGNADDYDIDISYHDLGYFEDGGYSDLDMFNYNDNGNFIRKIVVKHSPNIIDLIEEGDYVNGSKVVDLDDLGYLDLEDDKIKYDDIKSIVTKEIFNQVKYEV